MHNFVVYIELADGLASWDARASAGTEVTNRWLRKILPDNILQICVFGLLFPVANVTQIKSSMTEIANHQRIVIEMQF